jgi:hypothetical protein
MASIKALLALATSLGINAVIILVTLKPLYLTSWGLIQSTERNLYLTGTTILATILTGFIASSTQDLLLRRFDNELQRPEGNTSIKSLSRKWRVILKANKFSESFTGGRLFGIFLAYVIIGLITTSIVSGISPTVDSKTFSYPQKVYNGDSRITAGSAGNCTSIITLAKAEQVVDNNYYWDLGNGNAYYIPANMGGCPTRDAQLLVGLINMVDSGSFAYADSGVAVHQSAIGAPNTMYSAEKRLAPEFNSMLSTYGTNALETCQCVPVMKSNPISCRTGGAIKLATHWFNLTSDDGLCQYNRYFSGRDPTASQTMVKSMCTYGDVGQGTIVIAASGGYAHWLAVTIGDEAHAPSTSIPVGSATYMVTCTVDTRNIYEHRLVTLDMRASNSTGTRYSRFLKSNGTYCSGPPLDRARIATAAAANWQTLFQNDGSDGWFDLIWEATGGHAHRSPPWAFQNSDNPLEDAFGLVAALVGSRFNGTTAYSVDTTVEVAATRIGSPNFIAFLYLIPSGFAAILVAWLLLLSCGQEKAPFSSTELDDLRRFFQVGKHVYGKA